MSGECDRCGEHAVACECHRRTPTMPDWQPIETAPEKVDLLVLRRDGVMHIAKVSGSYYKYGILSADFGDASCTFFFPVGDDYSQDDTPTHWMPLPTPPEDTNHD